MERSANGSKHAPVRETKQATTDTHEDGTNERFFGRTKEEIGITVESPDKDRQRDMGNTHTSANPCPSSR